MEFVNNVCDGLQFRDTGTSEDEFCKGYEDYLQCPLQVRTNNVV